MKTAAGLFKSCNPAAAPLPPATVTPKIPLAPQRCIRWFKASATNIKPSEDKANPWFLFIRAESIPAPLPPATMVALEAQTGYALRTKVSFLNQRRFAGTLIVLAINSPLVVIQLSPSITTLGFTFTVITTVTVALQPLLLAADKVYVVVEAGLIFTVPEAELLTPVTGDQLYTSAPVAVISVVSPEQINVLPFTSNLGDSLTVIESELTLQPLKAVASTKYLPPDTAV